MKTDRLQNDDGNVAESFPQNRTRRQSHSRRNSGASLVEVLIVLVVILIGIFAVIQIFPIGFTTLKKSEARLRADRLARNATESLTVDSSSLPESITFSYYSTGVLQTITSEDPDNLGVFQGDPDNKQYFSDVNKFRYIKNEPVRVPLASATSGSGFGNGVGSVHFLNFGPIFMDQMVGDPTTAPTTANIALYNSYLKVTSEKLTGIVVDSADGTNRNGASNYRNLLRGANTYVIDYENDTDSNLPPVIAFAPAAKDRTFTVTYSYEDQSVTPAAVTSASINIIVPANSLVWNQLGTQPILPGSEIVVRDFVRLASAATWDATDPYEYKLASGNVSPNANLGVVAFNPAGANFSVSVPGGTKPFTALVSYAVLDWHILHDDREVPAGSDGVGKVRTSIPNIRVYGDEYTDLNGGDVNGDGTPDRTLVYAGLYPTRLFAAGETGITPITASPDIQVFNLNDATGTARLLVGGDLSNRATTDVNADFWVNRAGRSGTYPTGTIYINTNKVPAGSKVRILYKAQGDWAVAFQKAAKAYALQEDTANAGRPILNKSEVFAVDPMTNSGTTPYADDRIYFHRSELNKGVTAVVEIDTAAGTTRLPARQFSIRNAEGNYSYAQASDAFSELSSQKFNGNDITGWRIYGTINGASLKTRVIWQDEQNGRNPWRISDLETFVTSQGQ